MTGVFTGEYGFASVASSDLGLGDGVDSSIPLILRGLFRAQASNNMLAEHLVAAAEVMEGPLDALPARLTAYRGTLVPPHKWSLYNPVGHFLMNSYFMDFTRYGTRVTDLEGMRRALLIAAELRKAGVPPTKVEQHLAEHELTNPYTGEPLLWDEEEGAMVFDGLGDDSFYLPY